MFDSGSDSKSDRSVTPGRAPGRVRARKYQLTPDLLGELCLAYEAIQLIRQTRDGYAPAHLQKLFGASAAQVRHWIEKGLLGKSRSFSPEARVSKTDLLRFISVCYREYDLARVHQEWFKALVFGYRGKEI